MSDNLSIVMYHYVRNISKSRYPGIKGMNVNEFIAQIDFFENNYNIVRMEDVMEAARGIKVLPDKALLLTFDDGYIDDYDYVFPILDDRGLQGTFFIPGKTFCEYKLLDVNKIHYILASADGKDLVKILKEKMDYYRGDEFDYPETSDLYMQYAKPGRYDNADVIFVKRMLQTVLPEKLRNIISSELFAQYVGVSEETLARELYMSNMQIKTLKKHGMHIGFHGYDHYWLSDLSKEQMVEDINRGLEVMDQFIDINRWAIAYPYGSYNEDVLDCVRAKGACIGVTIEVGETDIARDNPLTLRRFDCNDFKNIV